MLSQKDVVRIADYSFNLIYIVQEQEKAIAKLKTEKDRIDRENKMKQQKIKDLEFEVQKLRKDIAREKNTKKDEVDRLKQQLKSKF